MWASTAASTPSNARTKVWFSSLVAQVADRLGELFARPAGFTVDERDEQARRVAELLIDQRSIDAGLAAMRLGVAA